MKKLLLLILFAMPLMATAQCEYTVEYKVLERECLHCHKNFKILGPQKLRIQSGKWETVRDAELARLYWAKINLDLEQGADCTSRLNRVSKHVWTDIKELEPKTSMYRLSEGETNTMISTLEPHLDERNVIMPLLIMIMDARK